MTEKSTQVIEEIEMQSLNDLCDIMPMLQDILNYSKGDICSAMIYAFIYGRLHGIRSERKRRHATA